MKRTRKVQVLKRDGSAEEFDPHKLAVAMWRGMLRAGGRYGDAFDLAMAIKLYLERTGRERISSAAIFEMTVKALRSVRMDEAAAALEARHSWRSLRRSRLEVRGDDAQAATWDKGWLVATAMRSWNLSPASARVIAGRLEMELLAGGSRTVRRDAVIERLNVLVSGFGLADAVPVHPPVSRE